MVPSTFKNYPDRLLDNEDLDFFFNAGEMKIPATIFEAPYKLFLSPIAPTIKGKRGRVDIGYVFENTRNKVVSYFETNSSDKLKKVQLVEPWNNSLIYQINYNNKTVFLPPTLKAIAYQNKADEGPIFPDEKHRKEIVEHTLLDFETGSRDVRSEMFNIGALGLTANLHYKNFSAKKNSSFVEWQQKIKNGKDNYVEIVNIGIDIRSGKKVLVSEITERVIHDGKSVMVMRLFLSFLETEKDYEITDFPYSHSILRDKGFYFRYVPLTGSIPGQLKVKDIFDPNKDNDPFIPVFESTDIDLNLEQVKDKVIKLEYSKFDKQGNEKKFKSHLAIVFKHNFDKNTVEQYLDFHRLLTANTVLAPYLREDTLNEKIAFVPAEQDGTTVINKNTSLSTEYFQFDSRKSSSDFNSNTPITQHLVYAKVTPPQIEGFVGDTSNHFEYSEFFKGKKILGELQDIKDKIDQYELDKKNYSYLFNGATITVNTRVLQDAANANYKQLKDGFDKRVGLYKDNRVFFNSINSTIETTLVAEKKDITGIFSKNLQNIGNLVNPDIVVSGLSELDQSLTLANDTVIETQDKVEGFTTEFKTIKTFDFLKGVDAAIFKDISLKSILQQVMPLDQTPIFEIVDKAEDGIKLITEYAEKYKELKNIIFTLPKQIEEFSKVLFNQKRSELEAYFDKRLEVERQKIELEINEKIVTPFEKNKLIVLEKHANEAKELINLSLNSTKAEIKIAFDIIANKGTSYILAALCRIPNKVILQYLISDKEFISAPTYTAIFNTSQSLMALDKSLSKGAKKAYETIAVELENINYKSTSVELLASFNSLFSKTDGHILAAILKIEDSRLRKFILTTIESYSEIDKIKFRRILTYLQHVEIELRQKDLIFSEVDVLSNQVPDIITAFVKEHLPSINYILKYGFFIEYVDQLKKEYKSIIPQEEIATELNKLTAFHKEIRGQFDPAFSDLGNLSDKIKEYQLFATTFNDQISQFKKRVEDPFNSLSLTRSELQTNIDNLNKQLNEAKLQLKNFAKYCIDDAKNMLTEANKELVAAYEKGEEQVSNALKEVEKAKQTIKKLLEPNQKTFKYRWHVAPNNFTNFKSSVVSFLKTETTSLDVYVKTDINYKISLDRAPQYLGTDVYSLNKLQNFKIGFFDVILIDFAEVTFESGTKIDTDFKVNINNIYFSGALTFISAFQNFLNALNFIKNLIDGGVKLDYSVPIPDITAGAFNFFNAKLYTGVFLPIASKKQIRFDFGFNSPEDMFLVSYGIFGGRGCFQIGLTPKKVL